MSRQVATPSVDANPIARIQETVDALEIFLELIQDESDQGFAPWSACRQYFERIRRLSLSAQPTTERHVNAPPNPLVTLTPW